MLRDTLGSTPRILFDVDAPGGSGAPAPVTPPATPPADVTPPTTPPAPAKDDGAATRYQISRERELRVKAEADRAELEKLLKTPKPVFDETTDPDGNKAIDYKIQQGIKDGLKEHVKELGLAETLEKIQYEKAQDEWFQGFEGIAPQFKELGLEPPTKQELQACLQDIDVKGISREQLAFLARMGDVKGLLKPKGFAPGDGGKPATDRTRSQEEINADIFKAFNM